MKFSKTSTLTVSLAIAIVSIFLIMSQSSQAQETKVSAKSNNQKIVKLRVDGGSFLLIGDPLLGTDKALEGSALPFLIEKGWHVDSVHMTGSAGVNLEQHSAYVLISK